MHSRKRMRRTRRRRIWYSDEDRFTSSDLSRAEWWALLIVVVVGLCAEIVLSSIVGDGAERTSFQILLALVFALPLLSPLVFVVTVVLLASASIVVDAQHEAVLVLALGSGIVVRLCSGLVQLTYFVVFVAIAASFQIAFPQSEPVSSFIAALMVAACVSFLGFALRASRSREMQSRRRLVLAEQARAEVVFEERRRLADDLHDIVAHDLTVIAMHARLLERTTDTAERRHSEREIIGAARKALADVRKLVMLGRDSGGAAELAPHQCGVSVALGGLSGELMSAGYRVLVENEAPSDRALDRLTSGALARIAREATTNILKHAPGPQRVTMRLTDADREVRLQIWNSCPSTPRDDDVDSGGYGVMRMSERTELLGGKFFAGAHDGGWLVEAVFPSA